MKLVSKITTLLVAGLAFSGAASATGEKADGPTAKVESTAPVSDKDQFKITRVTPSYWRVTIDHPPFNIYGPESTPMLNNVITQIEKDPQLKVVVFESAVPGFFLTHYDFMPPLEVTTRMPNGVTGLSPAT